MNTDYKIIKARDIKASQKNAVKRILQFYTNRRSYNTTSVRYELRDGGVGGLWIEVITRENDCCKNSMRQIMFEQRAHICIGVRGGLTIWSARDGLSGTKDEIKHVAFMLHAKISKYAG